MRVNFGKMVGDDLILPFVAGLFMVLNVIDNNWFGSLFCAYGLGVFTRTAYLHLTGK